jgi:hypothetical protein
MVVKGVFAGEVDTANIAWQPRLQNVFRVIFIRVFVELLKICLMQGILKGEVSLYH